MTEKTQLNCCNAEIMKYNFFSCPVTIFLKFLCPFNDLQAVAITVSKAGNFCVILKVIVNLLQRKRKYTVINCYVIVK